MGDFYELFFNDAVEASQLLGLTLTKRGKSAGKDVPLAGVPVHSSSNYIKKLLNFGKKVSICEQVEDSTKSKDNVKREVIKVLTPGTIIDEEFIDDHKEKYVCALDEGGAMAWCEVLTGKMFVYNKGNDASVNNSEKSIDAIFSRFEFEEILVNETVEKKALLGTFFYGLQHTELSKKIKIISDSLVNYAFWEFDENKAKLLLKERLKTQSLEYLGFTDDIPIMRASNALLSYIEKNIGMPFLNIKPPIVFSLAKKFFIDSTSQRALELVRPSFFEYKNATLLNCIDTCLTASGSKTLREWILSPLVDIQKIEERQLSVRWLAKKGVDGKDLRGIPDLSHMATRISLKKINPRQLINLTEAIDKILRLGVELSDSDVKYLDRTAELFKSNALQKIKTKILSTIKLDSDLLPKTKLIIKRGLNDRLDVLLEQKLIIENDLIKLEAREREKTGIPTLKIGQNNIHGYYIEVTGLYKNKIPEYYKRRQTLKNAERFSIEQLSDFDEKLIFIASEIDRLERLLFSELCEDLITYSAFVTKVSEHIATLDALLALARKVTQYNWVLPKNNSQNEIKIEKGWHPVLEQMDDKSGEPQKILKNDTMLTQKNNMMLITGPNMSGKSTYMRQVALIVILAKIGSPVPATSATVGKINSVFTRIGSADDLFGGRSTFMVEMTETAKILNVADENSLVLIDEIGRGTSTADGLSLAWSIAEELTVSNKALSLFSTHYFELTNLPKYKKTISNFHIETIEQDDKIIFLYKLKKGSASKSFGLKVAKLAGISQLVIDKAFAYQNKKHTFFASEQLEFHKPQTKEFQINYDFQKELSDLKIDELTPVKALLILQKLKESYSK